MQSHLLSTFVCYFAVLIGTFLHAHAAQPSATDALRLMPVGSDSTSKTLVFNQQLSAKQIQQHMQRTTAAAAADKFKPRVFHFLTDHGDNDRILVGVRGEQFELQRAATNQPLGRGGPYSDGVTTVDVQRGASRLQVMHPGPAACEDGYLESTEFFDANVRIVSQGRTFKINTTMVKQGCKLVPYNKTLSALPIDVAVFVKQRDGCDHFRGEEAYDAERRKDLARQMKKWCTGTDAKLHALKIKYATRPKVLDKLNTYEVQLERATH